MELKNWGVKFRVGGWRAGFLAELQLNVTAVKNESLLSIYKNFKEVYLLQFSKITSMLAF